MTAILITGGTGFIGSRLALHCLSTGQTVRVLGLRRTPMEDANSRVLVEAGATLIEGSVTDSPLMREACAGVDTVYHLAAAQHESNVPDRHFHEVNVEGTRTVLEAAGAEGVPRFVHGSTIGVFGASRSGPVTEATPLRPENIYGVTKLAGEYLIRANRDGPTAVIVRISESYGPGDGRLLKLFRAVASGRFMRVGSGRNLHHLIYVDDVIDGLLRAGRVDGEMVEPVVLAGPEPVSTDAMIDAVALAVDRTAPRLRVPLWPILGAAVVMETLLRPLGIEPPLHRRRMNFFVKSFRFDLERAASTLGFRPRVGFGEGAVRTAEWYRMQGLLPNPTQG